MLLRSIIIVITIILNIWSLLTGSDVLFFVRRRRRRRFDSSVLRWRPRGIPGIVMTQLVGEG